MYSYEDAYIHVLNMNMHTYMYFTNMHTYLYSTHSMNMLLSLCVECMYASSYKTRICLLLLNEDAYIHVLNTHIVTATYSYDTVRVLYEDAYIHVLNMNMHTYICCYEYVECCCECVAVG